MYETLQLELYTFKTGKIVIAPLWDTRNWTFTSHMYDVLYCFIIFSNVEKFRAKPNLTGGNMHIF
jgi:hypothetical protein